MTKKERLANEEFYRDIAKQFARDYWDVELTCPIVFVNRDWKSTRAYFQVDHETNESKIVMSHKVNQRRGTGLTIDTLKHELTHWYLWSIGEPFGDDDPTFVRECLRIGASISGTKKAQSALRRVCAEMDVSVIEV